MCCRLAVRRCRVTAAGRALGAVWSSRYWRSRRLDAHSELPPRRFAARYITASGDPRDLPVVGGAGALGPHGADDGIVVLEYGHGGAADVTTGAITSLPDPRR